MYLRLYNSNFKAHFVGLFLLVALLAQSCKLPVQTADRRQIWQPIPRAYDSFALDTGFAVPQLLNFYNDPLLVALIQTAVQDNLDLKIIEQRLEMATFTYKQSRLLQLPDIGIGASAGQRKFGDYTMDGIGNYDTNFSPNLSEDQKIPRDLPDYRASMLASWELDIWGKFKQMKKSAKARFMASRQARDFFQTQLVAHVSFAYYNLIALDKELEIVQNNIVLQERVVELIKAQKEGGIANELAVNQVKAQLLNTNAISWQLKQQIIEQELLLNNLLGRFPQPVLRNTQLPTALFNDSVSLGNPVQLVVNRPDVKEKEFELVAAYADVKVAQKAFLPSLQLMGEFGLNSFNVARFLDWPASITYNMASGLFAPVFNKGAIKAQFNITNAKQIEALYAYNKQLQLAYNEILQHLYAGYNAKQILEQKSKEVTLLKQAVGFAAELYATGNANYIEVITVQRNVLYTELELIHTQIHLLQQHLMLYKAIGGGL